MRLDPAWLGMGSASLCWHCPGYEGAPQVKEADSVPE